MKTKTQTQKKLTGNALIAEMRFFGIPIKRWLSANARKCGLIVARITFGLVAKRKTVR